MKRNLLPIIFSKNVRSVLGCLIILFVSNYSSAKEFSLKPLPNTSNDSILIQKRNSNKKHRVYLYPDADRQVLFFGVRGEKGKAYQLFLFDMEGRLVKQSEIRNKQTALIKNIEKGNYLFDVFSDDERIENGQIIVR